MKNTNKEQSRAEAFPAADSGETELAVRRRHEEVRKWLSDVKFRRCMLGGVDEADVWKKIGELNRLYEEALRAERVRYDTLLQEHGEKMHSFGKADAGRGE